MSRFKVTGHCLKGLFLIVSISLIPVGFGLLMMLYQHDLKHHRQVNEALHVTIAVVDEWLDGLASATGSPAMSLKIGDASIRVGGVSSDQARPSQAEFFQSGRSQKHGFTVTAGYPAGFSAQQARSMVLGTLPALALVGVVTGLIAYWSLFCPHGLRRRTAARST